jgi:predicted membrane channel-forming protein YqfA (hemolysin III family)
MLHHLKYDESSNKAAFRPRHPIVCLLDVIGIFSGVFFFCQAESPAVVVYLTALFLLYTCSALHHWVQHTKWGRTLDHTMIFVFLSTTAIPLWAEYTAGWLVTGTVIVAGTCFKLHTFYVGEESFSKGSSAVMYILAAVPQIVFFLVQWYGDLWSIYNWSWAVGSLLYLWQLGIYTKHWFDWMPEVFGYREVQHVVLLFATIIHCVTYVYLTA